MKNILVVVFLAMSSASVYAVCTELNGSTAEQCDDSKRLDEGITFFRQKDCPRAKKDFQAVMHSPAANNDMVTQATFYNQQCDGHIANAKLRAEQLKFQPLPTTRGQVLTPGQTPPPTTLRESQKALVPVSTTTAVSSPTVRLQ